jgi:hypothetical protein
VIASGWPTDGSTVYVRLSSLVQGVWQSYDYAYTAALLIPPPILVAPTAGATGVSVAPALSWVPAPGATSYEVYFGTSANPPLVTTINGTSYTPSALSLNTTYYWRVAARNGAGAGSSPTWSFITRASVPLAPDLVAITPASGSGSVQTFSAVYTAGQGYNDLGFVQILFATAPDGGGQPYCFLHYDAHGNRFWLYGEGGFFIGPIAPGATSNALQNSLCAIDSSASSVAMNGVSLTITTRIIFKAPGARNIYMRGMNSLGMDTGWVQRGTWTAAAAPLEIMTVLPSAGSSAGGVEQRFTMTYPYPRGFEGLTFGWVQFLVAADWNGGGQPFCFVHYDRGGNGLWMYSGDVGYFVGPATPGVASTALNSSACSVNAAGTTAADTAAGLVVSVPVTMKAPMTGAKNIYLRTLDAIWRDTSWVPSGSWTIR